MKSIRFLGASGCVTGSSFLLTGSKGTRLLIDCGMFQGTHEIEEQNRLPFTFDLASVNAVLLTHAHLDHCGRLPMLVKEGYEGAIYATKPTIDIAHISLLDSSNISKNDTDKIPLYTKDDVNRTYNLFKPVSYAKSFTIGEFTVTYHDAGHILGSASIEIFDNTSRIIFSGDLGNTPQDLIRPTSYIQRGDFIVMESTYGDRLHKKEDVNAILSDEINKAEHLGSVLLIPAFSIERTQEILHRLHHLKMDHKIGKQTPVFLDSPMAIAVTEVMKHYRPLYNEELLHDIDPFDFPHLRITKTSKESKAIEEVEGVKVIIAGSGMMSGGRILHHLKLYASNPENRICIVGYQAVETLGRKVEMKEPTIVIDKETVSLKASVVKIDSLSSHADQNNLLVWLGKIKGTKKVFLVHGENEARKALKNKIQSALHIDEIILPDKNEELSL